MEKRETADVLVRLYPSTYKRLREAARKRRTIIAEIAREAVEQLEKV